MAGLCSLPIRFLLKAGLCSQCALFFPAGMSLPANQLKLPSQVSLPANQIKEHSHESQPVNQVKEHSPESQTLCPDPHIVSAPLRPGCSGCPEAPAVRFPSSGSFSVSYLPVSPAPTSTLPPPPESNFFPRLSLSSFHTSAFPPPAAPPSSVQALICLFLSRLS